MKGTKCWLKAISLSLALASLTVFLSGCGGSFDSTDGEKTVDAMLEVISQVQSVETSITLDLQGRFSNGTSSDSGTHTAAVNSTPPRGVPRKVFYCLADYIKASQA